MWLEKILRGFRFKNGSVEKKSRRKRDKSRGRSHVAPERSLVASGDEQSPWANMPPELLHNIIRRVDAGATSWPGRRNVVACAAICQSWRETVKEVIRPPQQCGLLTFPSSLKQPGPRDPPIQCFIKRDRKNSIYRLYLGLSPAFSGDACKPLLAAKKVKRTTRTEFAISLTPDNFSRTSDKYMGRIRSNFFGTKFSIDDAQTFRKSATPSNGFFSKNRSSKMISQRSTVASITYELNVVRSRGPRRMSCTMHTIPIAAIREGGNAPTPSTFSSGPHDKLSSPASGEKTQEATSFLTQSPSGNEHGSNPIVLKNKSPRWHEQLQCWCLNFNGRVSVASVKNFQLAVTADSLPDVPNVEKERVILQFGKIGKDVFTMDFSYPLSAFQAFAISLSSFDTKPACISLLQRCRFILCLVLCAIVG